MRATPTFTPFQRERWLPGLALLLCPLIAHGVEPESDPADVRVYPPEQRPGRCAPTALPPARIVDVWTEMDRRENAAPQGAGAGDAQAIPPAANVPEQVIAEADRMELVRDGFSWLEGDVWLQQGERFLSADSLEFDQSTGIVRTESPARFGSRQLLLDAESVVYDLNAGEGLFQDTEYHLLQQGARGTAGVLARTGDFTARLEAVKYTTCPADDEDWWLKASEIDLDQDEGVGVAKNVRVGFMGVPFFYLPWMSFPITEDRKTGFLFPEFGDSGRHGAWLRVPYYFNLAPNYDALIAPYYMSKRGTMLEGRFRYLFGWGAGEITAEYLDKDRFEGDEDDPPPPDGERYYYRLLHASQFPADWRFRVNYQEVSDEEYFQDFGQSGTSSLRTNLAQSATLSRQMLEYGLSLNVLRYQTVDPTLPEERRPYEKWPELDYYYSPLQFADWLWLEVDGESVNFQRDGRLSGWRHHARSSFSTDFGDPGLRLTPQVAWWQTEYELEAADGTAIDSSRGLPVASLDATARFSRPLQGGGRQTLEPRLFYLYVPYRDQDDIPRFDTRQSTDTIVTLFQENRFTGPDRVGDQNRITFGIETGLVGEDGREWFTAAAARAWYLEDRRVTLSGGEPETETASDYYGAMEILPSDRHTFRMDFSWNPFEDEYGYGAAQYQFKPAETAVANLAYRYRRSSSAGSDPTRQADVSFVTPLAGRWSLFGRAVYSLEDERSQETLAGFEYENCCWVFRTFSRRFIVNRDGEMDQALWFQLELKGLSSVGRRIDEFLTENIYGYGDPQ